MTKDVSQSIEELVSQINSTIEGVYDAINQRTDICNTKWARVGKYVTDLINGQLLITEIDYDNYLVAGNANETLTLPAPYFVPGTKIAANTEWTKVSNDLTTKTPLIWLLHDVRYRKYGQIGRAHV